jgi:hypothetical protein
LQPAITARLPAKAEPSSPAAVPIAPARSYLIARLRFRFEDGKSAARGLRRKTFLFCFPFWYQIVPEMSPKCRMNKKSHWFVTLVMA